MISCQQKYRLCYFKRNDAEVSVFDQKGKVFLEISENEYFVNIL